MCSAIWQTSGVEYGYARRLIESRTVRSPAAAGKKVLAGADPGPERDEPALPDPADRKGPPLVDGSRFCQGHGILSAGSGGVPRRSRPNLRPPPAFGHAWAWESERLLRLAEIFEAALSLFDGDHDGVRQWLTSPVRGLGNARPIDYARTELGAREVRNLIGRLEDGVFS